MTITLALGVQRMARRNAIVRRLPAIEALGSVSVICSDKTGTLTKNEMTVASVATERSLVAVSGAGYAPEGGFAVEGVPRDPEAVPHLVDLARAGVLCADAHLSRGPKGWAVAGDPMEGALVTLALKAGLDPEAERALRPRRDVIPFDAVHRFMAVLCDAPGAGLIVVKGAPERLLEMCAAQRDTVGDEPIDPAYWRQRAAEIAARGERVLAVATRPAPHGLADFDFAHVETGLTLLGLVGFIDPPRPEAVAAVAECRAAGIDVKMITGDHAGTAEAIARQLGLGNGAPALTGAEIDALDDAALRPRARDTHVFARTSPAHKLRLVQALQAEGAVVAMTGDGVNDAPALKRADIGVAMGITGSEAAKEAAQMVLADDNFATIAAAVKAGRTVYDNLTKSILFVLPTNGGQGFVMIVAILTGLSAPITAVQILWINMVTAVTLGIALAFEPAEPGVMARPPRRSDAPLLSRFLVWRTALVSALFAVGVFGLYEYALAQGAPVEQARAVAVNALVAMEIVYLFSVRFLHSRALTLKGALGTPAVWIAVLSVIALQAAFTFVPFMQRLFGTAAITPLDAALCAGAALVVFALVELEKLAVRGLARG
jgi:magnesium-transporting ATPase (P-type)